MDHIADVLRRSGQTQAMLARLLGLSQSSFSDRMSGRSRWSVREVLTLAHHLGMSVDDLVGTDDLEPSKAVAL